MKNEQEPSDHDDLTPPAPNNPPSLLEAARALLEAREDQMVTRVEWDNLRDAVAAAEK